MKRITKIYAVAAITLLAATGAQADTASDSVDAKAGLQPALELSCTDVSFGVWRVPIRSAGGATTITLDASNDTVAASVNTTRVAQSTSHASWTHSRGECTVAGSTAADNTNADVSISGATAMPFTATDAAGTGFVGLAAPGTAAALAANLTVPATTKITSGASSFYVGGVLTIPQNIVSGNYGGYKTTESATVTVDDKES